MIKKRIRICSQKGELSFSFAGRHGGKGKGKKIETHPSEVQEQLLEDALEERQVFASIELSFNLEHAERRPTQSNPLIQPPSTNIQSPPLPDKQPKLTKHAPAD